MTAPTWTEAHRREALRRTYELAAELAAQGNEDAADTIACFAATYAGSESGWRSLLADNGFGAARIEREVRRCRGLAEGRLVRETVRRVGPTVFVSSRAAHHVASASGRPVVRVTRIRKVPAGGVGR